MNAIGLRSTLIVLGLLLVACQPGPVPDRCGRCGMLVDDNPRWVAAVVHEDGEQQLFCSPRCLTRWIEAKQWSGPAWVTEYYTQQRTALDEIFFIDGSDVTGPMGPAWVPVRGLPAAREFLEDHGGQSIFRHDGTRVEGPAGEDSAGR